MGSTACTEPQCLCSRAIPLLPLWAVRPVQSLSACTRVHFTFYWLNKPSGQLQRQHKYREVRRRISKQQKNQKKNIKYMILISFNMNVDFVIQMDGRTDGRRKQFCIDVSRDWSNQKHLVPFASLNKSIFPPYVLMYEHHNGNPDSSSCQCEV
jgi:hypothetical protein